MKLGKSVKNFLVDFGLTDKEIVVYTTLLKTGPNTIMNLARETDIKRSTTHNTVEELIKKGLVSQTNYGERRMVIAEDPDKLKFLMEQKKWDIVKLEKNLPDVIKSIYESVPNSKENTKVEVKYYQGERGFKEVCQRSVDNSTNEVFIISNVEDWRKVYSEEYGKEYYIPARLKKKVFLKQLCVNNQLGIDFMKGDKDNFRESRLLPVDFESKSTIIICDKEVSLMISSEPYTAIVIEDADLAESFRSMFNLMWTVAKSN